MRGFLHGMRALGYAEGRNVVIERRTAEGKLERLEAILRELAQAQVAVIVVTGNLMALTAKKITSTIPIVVSGMATPVEVGIVSSLGRPGGNVTGLLPNFGPELVVKRLEFLVEMLPTARKLGYLGRREEWDQPSVRALRAAASSKGLSMIVVEAQLPRIETTFAVLERERPDALYVGANSELFVHMRAIASMAARLRVPDFYLHSQAVEGGGLLSYGHDAYDLFRRAAGYVKRILDGAKPGDLAIEQIERYTLVLNLRTARALGLTVPQSILLRADRVIE
jgi:putative ABC transport system substrate-binding protein